MIRKEVLFPALLAASLALSPVLLGAKGAVAQSDKPDEKTPEELALEAVDSLMRALDLMIEKIPQYEMPEINERGDIIIRRKNPPESTPKSEPEAQPDEGPDETET